MSLDDRGAETVAILDGHAESLHQGARVPAEALLARHQRIAVVVVLHVAHLQIVRRADVVVGPEDQAGPFAAEKLPDRLDFFRRGLLLRDHMVETEHEQRVRVGEHPLVERQPVPAWSTRWNTGTACPVVSPTSSWNGTNA